MKNLIHGSLFLLLFINTLLYSNQYSFLVLTDKKTHFIGETFKLEFRFDFDTTKNIAEVNFSPPIFNNLKIKDKNITQNKSSQSWIYQVYATDDKNVSISSAYLDVALQKDINKTIGNFDEYDYNYLSLETKPLVFNIKKVQDIKLFGNFNINSIVKREKNVIKLKIVINGRGNLEDIGGYSLKIKDATIYKDKPVILKNSFTQNFVIVSQKSITIPPFGLKYIDSKTKKIVKKATKPIFINIIKEKEIAKDVYYNYLIYLFYLLVGILVGFLFAKIKIGKKIIEDKNFYEKIKEAKDTKTILKLLISADTKKYNNIIKELEDDIYISKNHKLTKKEIVKKIFTHY